MMKPYKSLFESSLNTLEVHENNKFWDQMFQTKVYKYLEDYIIEITNIYKDPEGDFVDLTVKTNGLSQSQLVAWIWDVLPPDVEEDYSIHRIEKTEDGFKIKLLNEMQGAY